METNPNDCSERPTGSGDAVLEFLPENKAGEPMACAGNQRINKVTNARPCLLTSEEYQRLVARLQSRVEVLETRVAEAKNAADREARRVRMQRKLVGHLRDRISQQDNDLRAAQEQIARYKAMHPAAEDRPARDVRVQSLRGALMRIGGIEVTEDPAEQPAPDSGFGYEQFDAGEFLPMDVGEQQSFPARVGDAVGSIRKVLGKNLVAQRPTPAV